MSSPAYPDVFIESSVSLSCHDKLALLTERWDAQEYKFPIRYNGGKLRKAQAGWFTTHTWLKYSVSADGVYCAPCFLFSEQDPRCKALSKVPVSDWSNIKKIIEKHETSVYHADQTICADNFCAVMRGEKKDIECSIATHYNILVEKNRLILVGIVDTIVFCGKQNIALRGHEDDMGNFKVQITNLPVEHCREVFRGVQASLDVDEATFLRECARWRTWWTDPTLANGRPVAPEDLSASLHMARKESFPSIRMCTQVLDTKSYAPLYALYYTCIIKSI